MGKSEKLQRAGIRTDILQQMSGSMLAVVQLWYITRRCSGQTQAQLFVNFTRHGSKKNVNALVLVEGE